VREREIERVSSPSVENIQLMNGVANDLLSDLPDA